MTRSEFLGYLRDDDFTRLFIECGWDNPTSRHPVSVEADGQAFSLSEAAQKKGFRVYVCRVDAMPASSARRAVDAKLAKLSHDNFVIYQSADAPFHHLWSVPVRSVDRRHLVTVEYQTEDQAAFLLEKVNDVSFGFADDESTSIVDVVARVNAAFLVNADKVTKDFYRGFRVQHKAFVAAIENLPEESDREWYASVMLNRLMFCYFIQKKGFLDGDTDYLGRKLAETRERRGADRFYASFYRGFLKQLFGEGLNAPANARPDAFRRKYGVIPYLNGGMFARHEIEARNPDLDIPDSVFESLFAFFDQWRWHLDSRLTATGRDINPDVLGYIFEQYINDRAQMGAYYTKEDITEYIGRNCIVPYLFEAVKKADPRPFAANGPVWRILREEPDRYVFAAVRKGAELDLPAEIERGVDASKPNLRKRRADWNRPAAERYALPTEIWRETVARRQRCAEVKSKIASGEIADIHDFITFNLDIRQFAEDVIRRSDDSRFVLHFYNALREVTVLDPTCGSGAFLFAALNILEPLYEACLDRMEEMRAANPRLFKSELEEIAGKFRSNRKYFVYKNIILRNLYGVDIMHEATEIARLRLFLKMVAVVDVDRRDPNLGLDPLPDIDFNVRCGNTLVGYATEREIQDGLVNGDMFAYVALKKKIEDEMGKAAAAFDYFRREQLNLLGSHEDLVKAKRDITRRLAAIRELLDRQLHATNGGGRPYEEWRRDTQPFHWYTEFYPVMAKRGGFDVIIGNPPYLEKNQISYTVGQYKTIDSGAVHAWCIERASQLLHKEGSVGMIVPLSLSSTQRMEAAQSILENERACWYSNYSWRPAKLFETVNRALTIFVAMGGAGQRTWSTGYCKWTSDNREGLFNLVSYQQVDRKRPAWWVPKCSFAIEETILKKVLAKNLTPIQYFITPTGGGRVYYRVGGGLYWKVFTDFAPRFVLNGKEGHSSRETWITVGTKEDAKKIVGILSSNLFWWWYTVTSNVRDLNPSDILNFRVPETIMSDNSLLKVSEQYQNDICQNSTMLVRLQKKTGKTETQSFTISKSKPIIDEIDAALAKHYGFTEEELDFIVNYDVKYRMGDELNADG